jgi:hypothetical protein
LSHIGTSLIFKAPEADLDNIAPRLGLSWDLFGDGSTSLRAGVGRGFDVLFGNLPLLQLPPQAQAENREGNACFLSPSPGWCINTDGGEPLNPSGLSDIRHNTSGFLASGGLLPVLPLDTTFDPIIARAATGAFVLDDDPLPETWTWTLSLQRELFGDFMVEARYVGTHAIHLFVQRHPNTGIPVYFNQPSLRLPVFTSTSQVPGSFAAGDPTLAAFDLARATGTSSSRMLSPYGFRGAMTEFSPIANSSYHGASAILRKRLSTEEWGGLMFNFNWTWSKTIDNIENDLFTSLLNPRRPFNHTDVSIQRGLSGMHRAHKVGLTWFYELPRWEGDSGAMNKLMNGWQFSGTYLYETGQPVTVIAFRDIDGNADFSALDFVYRNISGTAGVGTDSSAVCWDGALVSGFTGAAGGATCVGDTVGYVADTDNAEWIIPGRGGWTNSGRGNHIMGEINNVNIEIAKETPFWGEGRYIRFAAQFVNLFNHPSFTIGTGSVFGLNTPAQTNLGFVLPGSTNFLQDDSFSGGLGNAPFSRVIQFSLKVVF